MNEDGTYQEAFEVIRMLGLDMKVSSGGGSAETQAQGCKHNYVIQNDDGWYICQSCAEELRYNPNKPAMKHTDLYHRRCRGPK